MDLSDQITLLDKLKVFKIQGRDKRGRRVLQIVGKLFPARQVTSEGLKKYLEKRIIPEIEEDLFAVLYINTCVQRNENFPGISTIRSILDSIPNDVRDRIESIYFLHPGIQSRLFLATFGRLGFGAGGLYGKIKYVTRTEFLWESLKRKELELPEYVYDHDEELEHRTVRDHGSESDHLRIYDAPSLDSSVPLYSMRCMAQ